MKRQPLSNPKSASAHVSRCRQSAAAVVASRVTLSGKAPSKPKSLFKPTDMRHLNLYRMQMLMFTYRERLNLVVDANRIPTNAGGTGASDRNGQDLQTSAVP